MDDDDVPETPPDPPPPSIDPVNPSRLENEPLSIKLEGERSMLASFDNKHTGGKANMLGVLRHNEDARKWPKKLRSASEPVQEQSEQTSLEDSPRTAPDKPDKPDDEAVIPGDLQRTQGCPRADGNMHSSETNLPSRGTGPGGYRGKLEVRRGVEVDLGHLKVIKGAKYNGVHTMSNKNTHAIEMDTLCPVKDPGGPEGEQVELESIRTNWDCQNNSKGVGYDGNECRIDGRMSGARRDSK